MKYIVKNCELYLLGMCIGKKQPVNKCVECSTCTVKQVINECIQFQDPGRIQYLLNNKNLSDCGRQTVKILKLLDVEEVKE